MKSSLKNKEKHFSYIKFIYVLIKKIKKFYSKKNIKKIKFLFYFLSLFLIILFTYIIIFRKREYKNIQNYYENNIKEKKGEIQPSWFKEKLIIHSLGKYNNFTYLNSLEPLKYWYFEKKMHLMEADFMLTKDNHTILAHDYIDFNFTPTLEQFKKLKTIGNTTRMSFKDLVLFMEENKNLYIMTDTKYTDIQRIEIEFDEMTAIINNKKDLYERFIIEIYNEKMFLFIKQKNYLFKYFVFTLYQRWEPINGLEDLENIFIFCNKYKINGILFFSYLLNESFLKFSRNYSIPIYLHTVNDIGNSVYFMNKGVKGIITDNITYELLEKYLLDNNIQLNQANIYNNYYIF